MADADLDSQILYIAIDNVQAALRIQDRVLEAVDMLGLQPRMGRMSAVADVRELVIGGTPYIALYRIETDRVLVLRPLHGAERRPG